MARSYRLIVSGGMLMYTNADMTLYLYNSGAYTRVAIEKVFWSETKQSNVRELGIANADSLKVMIPFTSASNLNFTLNKDVLVKDIVTDEIDATSQQTVSQSLDALKKKYKVFTVSSADDKGYGSQRMHHYDLSCK